MRQMRTADCPALQRDNESDAVLLERRWFAAHKAARAMRSECEILREVADTAAANWRDARTKLADLDALCDALESQYVRYVDHAATARGAPQIDQMSAA